MTKKQIMQKLSASRLDKVPPGWRTADGWAKKWKSSGAQGRKILLCAYRAGLAERRAFRIWNGTTVYPTPHYKFKGGK